MFHAMHVEVVLDKYIFKAVVLHSGAQLVFVKGRENMARRKMNRGSEDVTTRNDFAM